MIKQSTIALCSVMALASAQAFAAREAHTFEVSVDIPTLDFYVLPAEANWIHLQQTLPWNIHTSTLQGLRKNFDVKHSTSAIEARLDAEPYLFNGRDAIFLQVSFNGQPLSHDPPPPGSGFGGAGQKRWALCTGDPAEGACRWLQTRDLSWHRTTDLQCHASLGCLTPPWRSFSGGRLAESRSATGLRWHIWSAAHACDCASAVYRYRPARLMASRVKRLARPFSSSTKSISTRL